MEEESRQVFSNDITADLKPGDIQPWAAELYLRRRENFSKNSPSLDCLPWGPGSRPVVAWDRQWSRPRPDGLRADPTTLALTPEVLEAYTGSHQVRKDGRVTEARIVRTGADLFIEESAGRRLLKPLAADAFADVPDGRLEFAKDAHGRVRGFTVSETWVDNQRDPREIAAVRV